MVVGLSGENPAFGVESHFSHTINLFHECENQYLLIPANPDTGMSAVFTEKDPAA